MINHRDIFPYSDAKAFLDQTEDAQALPFLIDIAPFMDEKEWLMLLNATWPRIKNLDQYRDALMQTPYASTISKNLERE